MDKRIDVLAAAMQAGMQAPALKELDLAYAPPFSSANDPVNIAGLMAENVLSGKVKQFFPAELSRLPHDAQRLDVRTREEDEEGRAEEFDLLIRWMSFENGCMRWTGNDLFTSCASQGTEAIWPAVSSHRTASTADTWPAATGFTLCSITDGMLRK